MENKTPTPRTDEAEVIARKKYEAERECGWPAFDSSGFDFARALELELNEANEAFHVNAEENIQYRKALTTAQQEIAELRNAIKVSLIRAFTTGHQRGHEDTVEGTFVPVYQQDVTTYFEEAITEAIFEGSFPELDSAMKGANSK